jgi:hypothetical protein
VSRCHSTYIDPQPTTSHTSRIKLTVASGDANPEGLPLGPHYFDSTIHALDDKRLKPYLGTSKSLNKLVASGTTMYSAPSCRPSEPRFTFCKSTQSAGLIPPFCDATHHSVADNTEGRLVFVQSLLHPEKQTIMSGTDANVILGHTHQGTGAASYFCRFPGPDGGFTYDAWTASDVKYTRENHLHSGNTWPIIAFPTPDPLGDAKARQTKAMSGSDRGA